MKHFTKSILVVLGVAALLFGCQPDGVKPKGDNGNDIAGAAGDVHPTLDTVCKYSDTVFFRSNDGSYNINKCGYWDELPTPVACDGPQEKWGFLQMYNGYLMGANSQANSHWLDVSFSIAYGWYCDFNAWEFTIANGITIDPNTGFPSTGQGTDWNTAVNNPPRAEWKVQVLVNSLPTPCFDLACKLSLVPIDVNGLPLEGYRTEVRAINRNWDVEGDPEQANNEFAIHYCPFGCLDNNVGPVTTTECVALNVGISELSNCVTLDAGTYSGATYLWSNGATTQTISACPTASTTYSVSVTQANAVTYVKNFNVNYQNVKCSAGNSPQHKVRVCHRPPGNPTNVQNICIDWSGVPAHVAKYRPAGSNPNMGHDSGCMIGNDCNANPCGN
jgi:hypothetical protein